MASVRQKKAGIRAVSSTPAETSTASEPGFVSSPHYPQATSGPQRNHESPVPKVPATAAVIESARNKGKRSPSAATTTTVVARGGGIRNSPTQGNLIAGRTGNK